MSFRPAHFREPQSSHHAPAPVSYTHLSLYIYPEIQIYDSEICSIMLEISPLFVDYCTNIHLTCERVYVWLQQTLEGKALEKQLLDLFDDKIDLIHSQHGELELLANFPQLILGADW